jgi:hypothetical protein
MCTLITVVVPSRSDLARLTHAPIRLTPLEDPTSLAPLHPGEVPCWPSGVPTCSGGGHCGTVLGSEAHGHGLLAEERDEGRARRLRRQGWSEHKVQAWLAQRRQVRPTGQGESSVAELSLWRAFLHVALEEAFLRSVGLMVHQAGDAVPLRDARVRLVDCALPRLEQGVLYRVHR